MLHCNAISQAMLTNKRIPESLHNDFPCRRWLHLLHELIKYTNQALLGIAVLQVNGVHGDFGDSQHTSKCLGLRLNIKYFTDHLRNVLLTQKSIFELVSLCKRKAKKLYAVPFSLLENSQTVLLLAIHFKRFFQVSTLSIEPVISYLCHKHGSWLEDRGETANKIDSLVSRVGAVVYNIPQNELMRMRNNC